MCLVKPFNHKMFFFVDLVKFNSPKKSCTISSTLHDSCVNETEKD